jgi:hypothetical protein
MAHTKIIVQEQGTCYSAVFIGFIDTEDYYQNVNMSYFHILVVTRKTPKML